MGKLAGASDVYRSVPDAPLLLFDGDCSFCKAWIAYWKQLTAGRVEYAPSQEVGAQYPQIPPEEFKRSVQLVMPDGAVFSGAEAVFRSLATVPETAWLLWTYQHVPGFAPVSETAYRFVAGHRDLFYSVTRWTVGIPPHVLRYEAITWLFLRALAVIYACAFGSLLVQVMGLIGSNGILPAADFFREVGSAYGSRGPWLTPSVFWWNASDAALRGGCWLGLLASLLLLLNVWPRWMLGLLFVLYLSYASAGQIFLGYQWDILLTEVGFLSLFLGTTRLVVWLFRWLLFRLYFLSAAVKLLSGDVAWRTWQALRYHYETQPLPTPVAWYFHHLPNWWQTASAVFVLVVEGIVPFLIFAPRRIRHAATVPIALLQVLILLTGNYGFFNWLTLALCLFLLDDAVLPEWLLRYRLPRPAHSRGRWVFAGPALLLVLLTSVQLWQTLGRRVVAPFGALMATVAPFNIANSYGLFAVMTTTRPEILVEGSDDNVTWKAYEFREKPGDLRRAPPWVAPHLPRLDWQMWFAALSDARSEAWMLRFLAKLLEGSPDVLKLLYRNPFPDHPPHYVRAQRYLYRFSDAETRRRTGQWWTRQFTDEAVPVVSLRQ